MDLRVLFVFVFISVCYIHESQQSKEFGENNEITTKPNTINSNDSIILNDSSDYYWRDYKGIIPKDALAAGCNSYNETTYIAQVLYKNLLIPGEINDYDKRAFYEWGLQKHEATENAKIFCTRRPRRFRWIKTTSEDFKTLNNKNLIPGGYEPNSKIYIGRKHIQDAIVIGKVRATLPDLYAVFFYVIDGNATLSHSFEVLSYL